MVPKTLGFSSLVDHARRYFVGTAVTPCLRYVSGVLLRVADRGYNANFELIHQLNIRVPSEVRAVLQQGGTGLLQGAHLSGMASRMVSELHVINVERLLHSSGVAGDKVLAIGQRGPVPGRAFWRQTGAVHSIGDAAILAEATGLSVIDHFEQRDIAKGGSARGIDTLPLWLLVSKAVDSHSARPTVVVRLEESFELFYLPGRRRNRPQPALGYVGPIPGFALLETLLPQCREEKGSVAPIERLASELAKLLESLQLGEGWWESESERTRLIEAIQQHLPEVLGCRTTLNQALEALWAKLARRQISGHFPSSPEIAQVLIVGRGARRENLIQQIGAIFPGVDVTTDLVQGRISGATSACIAAVLAAMHVDQVCGNVPDLTGASAARVLGRITPGAPANWRGVLAQMEIGSRQTLPLREAI